jgi:DNA ligase (NAD+)
VRTPADLYELTVEDLAALEGWGERSAEKLVAEIEATREPPLANFLVALGIHDVGTVTARNLAREFGTFAAIRAAGEAGEAEAFEAVDDVGPLVAESICDFFEGERNEAVLADLLDHVDPQSADTETGDALDGLTFVFTGSLDGYTRSEAQELVERHGGSATSSVSGNTDYLVMGDNPGQSKRDDAAAEDVETVDEDGFEALLAERGVEN